MSKSFYQQMEELLINYGDQVAEVVKDCADKTIVQVNEAVKENAPTRTGKYLRAFATKTVYEDRLNKRNTWYVKAPHYRLTHLLENKHKTRGRKRETEAIPHIADGQAVAEKMEDMIAKEIEKL